MDEWNEHSHLTGLVFQSAFLSFAVTWGEGSSVFERDASVGYLQKLNFSTNNCL